MKTTLVKVSILTGQCHPLITYELMIPRWCFCPNVSLKCQDYIFSGLPATPTGCLIDNSNSLCPKQNSSFPTTHPSFLLMSLFCHPIQKSYLIPLFCHTSNKSPCLVDSCLNILCICPFFSFNLWTTKIVFQLTSDLLSSNPFSTLSPARSFYNKIWKKKRKKIWQLILLILWLKLCKTTSLPTK